MVAKLRLTEQRNPASEGLDLKPTREILRLINREDRKVALAVGKTLPQIERAVELASNALASGGRMIYLGAGTSGRLGVLDAAECIPTFGTDQVIGILAGGHRAMFQPTEVSEDDPRRAARDLRRLRFNRQDVLVGISASGRTPYTLGGLRYARRLKAKTIALTSNPLDPLCRLADVSIVPVVGPEVVAGSTRMKAGTAAKLVLNMLSTAAMIRRGRVLSGWMIRVQVKNEKLRKRGQRILMKLAGVSGVKAAAALERSRRNLPVALLMLLKDLSREEAARRLGNGADTAAVVRDALAERAKPTSEGVGVLQYKEGSRGKI